MHHSPTIITRAQEDLEHGYDLEDGFGGREKKEGTRFAEEKGTRFAEARAHDLQRRRAHDLQRLGHTICRGGGHTFLHRRRAHGRRKWYDLFLLSLDFLTSFP
jgi:hypothetical protein